MSPVRSFVAWLAARLRRGPAGGAGVAAAPQSTPAVIGRCDRLAGADGDARRRIPNSDGVPSRSGRSTRYLAVGKPGDRRGYAIAIRAFALGGKLGDRLTLVGFGRHRRRLERWTKALGVDAIVLFSDAILGDHLDLGGFDAVLLVSPDPGCLAALVTTAVMQGLTVVAPQDGILSPARVADRTSGYRPVSYDIGSYSRAIATISAE